MSCNHWTVISSTIILHSLPSLKLHWFLFSTSKCACKPLACLLYFFSKKWLQKFHLKLTFMKRINLRVLDTFLSTLLDCFGFTFRFHIHHCSSLLTHTCQVLNSFFFFILLWDHLYVYEVYSFHCMLGCKNWVQTIHQSGGLFWLCQVSLSSSNLVTYNSFCHQH